MNTQVDIFNTSHKNTQDIIEYLKKYNLDQSDIYKVFLHSVEKENIELVEFIVNKYPSNYWYKNEIFWLAGEQGSLTILKLILQKVKINADSLEYAMRLALRNDYLPVVKYLISVGASIDQLNYEEKLKLGIDELDSNPMFESKEKPLATWKYISQHLSDKELINIINNYRLPYQIQYRLVKMSIIAKNATILKKVLKGMTVSTEAMADFFSLAIYRSTPTIVAELINAGYDPTIIDVKEAINNEKIDIAKYLLSLGVDAKELSSEELKYLGIDLFKGNPMFEANKPIADQHTIDINIHLENTLIRILKTYTVNHKLRFYMAKEAIRLGHRELLHLLLSKTKFTDKELYSLVTYAINYDSSSMLMVLKNHGVKLTSKEVGLALDADKLGIAMYLIHIGIDISTLTDQQKITLGKNPIEGNFMFESTEISNQIIADWFKQVTKEIDLISLFKGNRPTHNNTVYAIKCAIAYNRNKVLSFLVKGFKTIYDYSFLNYAIERANLDGFKLLVNLGLKPRESTLKFAINEGNTEIAQFIIEQGVPTSNLTSEERIFLDMEPIPTGEGSMFESVYHAYYPKHRGEFTIEKVIRRIKGIHSLSTKSDLFTKIYATAYKEISNFNSPEELMDNIYWHGTGSYVSGGLKAGFTQIKNRQDGGGGYGKSYHTISLSKDKNIASNFTSDSTTGTVYPVLLRKYATVVDMPEITDAEEIEEKLVELWLKQVDAVKAGEWTNDSSEQELIVLNPKAILKFYGQSYRVFHKEKFMNPDIDVYTAIFDTVKNTPKPEGKENYLTIKYPVQEEEEFSMNKTMFLLLNT